MIRGPSASRDELRGWGLKTYSQEQLASIHEASLEVLRHTGIAVATDEALRILDQGGCLVDRESRRVKFPSYLVEEALASAPRQVLLAGRDPQRDFLLGGRRVGFTNFGIGIQVVDPVSGEVTESTKADVGRAALLCDALEAPDICLWAVLARDMPDCSYDLHTLEAALANTGKHVSIGDAQSGANGRLMLEMASYMVGGKRELAERPIVSITTCPVSPLQIHTTAAELIVECARWNVPVCIMSMAMSGASSPVSVSGTLVTHHAEVLAGITLAQLTNPGAPIVYGSSSTMFDMKTGTAPVGSPELGMISAAATHLAQLCGVPSWVAGCWTDSKLSDAQAGHEKTITAMLPALAGANMIYGMASTDLLLTLSLGQYVIDDEIVSLIKRVLRGSPTDQDRLGLDVIHEVGSGRNFIKEKHTLKYMPEEQSKVKLFDRRTRGAWEKRGGADVATRANRRAVELLESHTPLPLEPGVQDEIRRIIASVEERAGITVKA